MRTFLCTRQFKDCHFSHAMMFSKKRNLKSTLLISISKINKLCKNRSSIDIDFEIRFIDHFLNTFYFCKESWRNFNNSKTKRLFCNSKTCEKLYQNTRMIATTWFIIIDYCLFILTSKWARNHKMSTMFANPFSKNVD